MNDHKRLADEMRGLVLKLAPFMPKEHGGRGRDFDGLRGRLYEVADRIEALVEPAQREESRALISGEHKRLAYLLRDLIDSLDRGEISTSGAAGMLEAYAIMVDSMACRVVALGKPAITQEQIEDALVSIRHNVTSKWDFNDNEAVREFCAELFHRLRGEQAREAGESRKMRCGTDESVQPDQGSPDAPGRTEPAAPADGGGQ